MEIDRFHIKLLALFFLSLFMASCAAVRLQTLPAPPGTARLRVFLYCFSDLGGNPVDTHRQFSEEQVQEKSREITTKLLQEKGIYEVISREDTKVVLGNKKAFMRSDWAKGNWALALKAGRAAQADYSLIIIRSWDRARIKTPNIYWEIVLINTETGKKFRVINQALLVGGWKIDDYEQVVLIGYRALFRNAQEDMLDTAIRKGRLVLGAKNSELTKEGPISRTVPASPSEPVLAVEPSSPVLKGSIPEKPAATIRVEPPKTSPAGPLSPLPEPLAANASPPEVSPAALMEDSSFTADIRVDLEKEIQALTETRAGERKRLAVYDLDSVEQNKIVALILSEALREELFRLGNLDLINRENLIKVLKEIELQQTGLLDEKYAVQTGKGLTASHIVMGQFGALGLISVLQAKRIDVETQATVSLGSLKCAVGREEEFLRHMPELARKLVEEPETSR